MYQRFFRTAGTIVLFFLLLSFPGTLLASTPEIAGEAAVVIEYETGRILYEKNARQEMYPASTTKILTALLALEHLELEQVITVPEDQGPADGSAMYLLPGEQFTVRNLLDGLMVKSANDAAVLLARTISGSEEAFALEMNRRAAEIGATDTHFVNPNGLPDERHVTTAYDMALIAREAMENPVFRELVGQVYVTLDETPQTPEKRYFRNTNRFLWSEMMIPYRDTMVPIHYESVDGIKTGYTTAAGHCLVSSGEKNGVRVVSVVLKSSAFELYSDSRALLDYGFENFSNHRVVTAGTVLGSSLYPGTIQETLEYAPHEDLTVTVNHTENPDPRFDITPLLDPLNPGESPVEKGDRVGTLKIRLGEESWELPLYAENDLEPLTRMMVARMKLDRFLSNRILVPAAIVAVLLMLLLLIPRLLPRRRKRYRIRRISRNSGRIRRLS